MTFVPETTHSSRPRTVLGVMAKYWTSGQVKTRLGQTIGLDAAAKIHHQFVIHLAETLRDVADQRVFAVTPSNRLKDFQAELPAAGWALTTQADGDLGRRIEGWFRESLASSASGQPVASVLIGADCPCLGAAEIKLAFQQLADNDVVLGPAVDGGYYLIGLRTLVRPLPKLADGHSLE